MKQKLAVFDWDGTIRPNFTINQWLNHLVSNMIITGDTTNQLNSLFISYEKKEINHDQLAYLSAGIYATSVKNISKDLISNQAQEFVSLDRNLLFRWSKEILSDLNKQHIDVIIISGAPLEILGEYRNVLKLNNIYGLDLEMEKGIFTGNILRNPGISSTKEILIKQIEELNNSQIVLAMGNSTSDIPLFHSAPINIIVNNSSLITNRHELHITEETSTKLILEYIKQEMRKL
jgi:HAD superfamily phosphoserine phosphatase-like hydrolase